MVLSYPDNFRVLPGMLNRVDLVPLYYAANATLIPSRSEPFGLVALESMASGTPVVASRTGGLINIITDVRAESMRGKGTLFTPGDINDMVESTIHLVRLVEELYKTPIDNTVLEIRV
ncbi:MAG: glycosyltransferase [Desulfurococcaceae archaeon]